MTNVELEVNKKIEVKLTWRGDLICILALGFV